VLGRQVLGGESGRGRSCRGGFGEAITSAQVHSSRHESLVVHPDLGFHCV